MKLKIEPFSVEDEKEVLRLLSVFELPTEDLTINKLQDFIVLRQEDGFVIGAVAPTSYVGAHSRNCSSPELSE